MTSFDSKQAVSRFKLGIEVTRKQRARERRALAFMVPENQWDEQAKTLRNGTVVGGSPVTARPMLTVSKIAQPIQLIKNQFREANLGINVHPVSEKSNKETAQVYQGLIRQIERDSNAVIPRSWAFDRGVEAGFGVYRILTVFDETSDEPTDQKIVIEGIYDQAAVIFDPSAQKPDYRDGNWAFVVSYMPIEEFRAEYPKAKISKDSSILEDVYKERPDWVDFGGDRTAVLVAEYWCKKQGGVYFHKVAPSATDEFEVLEETQWNGKFIPLIPVIGTQMQPFDKERRYSGIVEPSMDSQKGYNYAVTTAIEVAALEPKAPFVGAEGQFEGHEDKWNTANVRNWAYLEYKPTNLNDHLTPPPQRMQADTSKLQSSIMLMQTFDQAIQATTYTPNPALGKRDRDESGKAIEALQNQSLASTSNYMTNMAQISMQLEGDILIDLIPKIYDREGRIIRILDMEDETQEVMVNQPFVMGPDGRPAPASGLPQGMSTTLPQGQPSPKTFNLSEGKYGISISIGKSYPTRMEQGKQTLMQLFEIAPDLVPLLLPTLMSFSDEPWAQEVEKMTKKLRDQKFGNVTQGEEGNQTPEQMQAALEAMKAKAQEMEGVIQEMGKALETEQIKQQATMQKTEMDNQTKMMIEEIDNRAAERELRLKQEGEERLLLMQQRFELALEEFKAKQAEKQQAKQMEHAENESDKAALNGMDTENRA